MAFNYHFLLSIICVNTFFFYMTAGLIERHTPLHMVLVRTVCWINQAIIYYTRFCFTLQQRNVKPELYSWKLLQLLCHVTVCASLFQDRLHCFLK
jgi:hypothetical protein